MRKRELSRVLWRIMKETAYRKLTIPVRIAHSPANLSKEVDCDGAA